MSQDSPPDDDNGLITVERQGKLIREVKADPVRGATTTIEYPDMDTLRGAGGRVTYARSFAWPLDFYFRRGYIVGSQHKAGCDYHRIWKTGVIRSGYTQTRYEVRVNSKYDPESALKTDIEYQAAHAAIRDKEERNVAYLVCCLGETAGRGKLELLRNALNDLYNHFRRLRDSQYRRPEYE